MENWSENIQEISLKTRDMEEELFLAQMETDMTDFGSWEILREKEEWFMQMRTSMKDSGMKEKETGMEFLLNEMVITLKVIGWMIKEKVKVHIILARKISCLLVNGSMINLNVEFIQK